MRVTEEEEEKEEKGIDLTEMAETVDEFAN